MTSSAEPARFRLRESTPAKGFGPLYAIRTARAWWYSAWLRTLARFSRTYLGSFWLGLSNLLSVAVLGLVYSAVLNVPNPYDYAIYLGLGLTIWGILNQSITGGCLLFTTRRDHLVNNALPAIFYCLEEWAFQIQTFAQAFLFVIAAFALIRPSILLHSILLLWLPMLNLFIFCLWAMMAMAILGARFKDLGQLMPIVLQVLFLVSPILYPRSSLKKASFLADLNPLYRILAPVRTAVMEGDVHAPFELLTLGINLFLLFTMMAWLKRLRYRLPMWI